MSSIRFPTPDSHSHFAMLPPDPLQRIASFLSYKDQGQLALTCQFTSNAIRNMNLDYSKCMAILREKIQSLPQDSLPREKVQQLFVDLVTSPAIGHLKYWVPVMNEFIERERGRIRRERLEKTYHAFILERDTVLGTEYDGIQLHAWIVDLLATSELPISSDQIFQFFGYLCQNQLRRHEYKLRRHEYKYSASFARYILEHYQLKLKQRSTSINRLLKEYLIQEAREILPKENFIIFSPDKKLKYQQIDINIEYWCDFYQARPKPYEEEEIVNGFWFRDSPLPLFKEDEIAFEEGRLALIPPSIPPLLVEVLWARIQSLRNSCKEQPFMVTMKSAGEPSNFTLPLARLITDAEIFLDHYGALDPGKLNKPNYARHIRSVEGEPEERTKLGSVPKRLSQDQEKEK